MTPPENVATIFASSAQEPLTGIAQADAVRITRIEDAEPLTVKLTSYNAVPEQTDGNPHVTASGAFSNPEVVAARSIDLAGELPFGTVIEITREESDSESCRYNAVEELIGYRVVLDSMHSRKRDQIDVLLNPEDTIEVHGKETNPSVALGFCKGVTVRVIGTMKISDVPETQAELKRIVEGNTFALR